jgi:hypothetical protein
MLNSFMPKVRTEGLRAKPVHRVRCSKYANVFRIMGSYEKRRHQHVCPRSGGAEVKRAISVVSAKPPFGSF